MQTNPINLATCQSSHQQIPPQTPLLYSKNGVCRGILIFLCFDRKQHCSRQNHIGKAVLAEAVLTCTHNVCFGRYIILKKSKILNEIFIQQIFGISRFGHYQGLVPYDLAKHIFPQR